MHTQIKNLCNTVNLYAQWLQLEALSLLKPYGKSSQNAGERPCVALLSYCMPPQFNSGTHRPLSFLKYARKHGWSIFGITNSPLTDISAAGEELFKLVPDDTPIYEYPSDPYPTSWNFTPQVDGGLLNTIALVKRAIPLLKQQRPDAIIASGPPFNFVIAGLYLSRMFQIPLVLDYRDEWTLYPFDIIHKGWLDRWFEARCITQAKKIIYTTDSHVTAHASAFDIPADKQAVVFNGWDVDQNQSVSSGFPLSSLTDPHTEELSQPRMQKNSTSLTFVGKLSNWYTNLPESLQLILDTLPEIEGNLIVRIIGEKHPSHTQVLDHYRREFNRTPNGRLHLIPAVPKSQALAAMRSSDYLLMLIPEEMTSYLPIKLYDYLSQKKTVVAIGFPGEVSSVLEDTSAGVLIGHEQKHKLGAVLNDSISPLNTPPKKPLGVFLSERTRHSQADRLYTLLNELLEPAPKTFATSE